MDLKLQAASSVKWTGTSGIIVSILQFIQLTVLARLLEPSDFGLMALVLVVLGFARLFADMGISNAIIYRQDATVHELSSLYWASLASGLILFFLLSIAAPLVTWVFHEPRLKDLIIWTALVLLITPIGQQFQVLLQKELFFGRLAIIDVIAVFAGTITAIATAWYGAGVYAFIWGQLVTSVWKVLLLVRIGSRHWQPSVHFQFVDLRRYLEFGIYQLGERTVNYVNSRLDQVIIGSLLGVQLLGYYTLAFNLVILPIGKINPIFTRVAFPVFAKVQNDLNRLRNGYFTLMRTLSIINFPLFCFLFAAAPTLVPLLFGSKWQPSVILIQLLALVAILRSHINPISSLFLSQGYASLGFKWNVIVFFFQMSGISIGAHLFGLIGAATSQIFLFLIYTYLNYLIVIRKCLGRCVKRYAMSMLPTLLVSIFMAVCVMIIDLIVYPEIDYIKLGIEIAIAALLYIGIQFFVRKDELVELLRLTVNKEAMSNEAKVY